MRTRLRRSRLLTKTAFCVLLISFATTARASVYSDLVLSYNPVAYWRLGETSGTMAADVAGGFNGTYHQGVTLGQPSAIDGDTDFAARFDGTTGYVEVPHNDAFLLDQGSIVVWIYPEDVNGFRVFLSKDASSFGTGGGLSMLAYGPWVLVRLRSVSNSYLVFSTPITSKMWHQVVFTFGPQGMKLYVDGALTGSNPYAGGLGPSSGGAGNFEPWAIGAGTHASRSQSVEPLQAFYRGIIDEVTVFSQQLSDLQVQELYNASLPNYTSLIDAYLANSPVAWWRLSETPGAKTAVDAVGNNDGTYVGPTLGAASIVPGDTAADFDGVNDSVNVGAVDVPSSAMTILLWFRADDFDVSDARLISKATGTSNDSHYWMVSTISSRGRIRLRFRLKTKGQTTTLSAWKGDLEPNTWTFVAAVYDGEQMAIYKDGVRVGAARKNGTIDANPKVEAWIGDNPSGSGSRPFDGTIDEVAIFDKALTPQQLNAVRQASDNPTSLGVRVQKWIEKP